MVDTRKKQTRKKQQSVTGKNAIHVEMWRFYFNVGCGTAGVLWHWWDVRLYVQIVNHDFLQNKANANILRTEKHQSHAWGDL